MKKRVLAGMLIALAVCSVTACGKNKEKEASVIAGSAIISETSGTETSQMASQTPETSQTDSQALEMPQTGSQTADASQTSSGKTVAASISLEEDMSSVSYVLLARMISEYEGSEPYDMAAKANGDSFWKEMNYLVSAYGVNNKRITFDEETKEYTLKKAQLRYYAAALYSDLGKAKKLPEIEEGNASVTRKGSKWKFAMNDTSAYDISIQSCSKQQKNGTYQLSVYLVDSSSQTSLGEYAAVIKKSPYKGAKSPFHYTIVSLQKMTKMDMETVLVGDQQEETKQTSQAGLTADGQTDGTQTGTSSSDSGTSQYGQVLSMPGTSTNTGSSAASQTSQTDTSSGSASTGTDTSQQAAAGSEDSDIAGATITSDAAMELAKKYYGAADDEGTAYVYKYEGTTTYQNVPYYNFSVSKGEETVIHVLVSGDGARIYKGTNTNGSWTMQ